MGRKKKVIVEEAPINNEEPKNRIIMGVDISTNCIGVTLLLDDGSEYGQLIEVTHIRPKIPTKIKGTEALVRKKVIFDEFIKQYTKYKIDEIIIEEPLMGSSKGIIPVVVLLKFNGMLTSSLYETFGIVPKYISSYDARKYAYPSLLAVRKRNKDGSEYPYNKILNDVKKGHLVLFGSMAWDVDKKVVLQQMVDDTYPDIPWVYDKNGELAIENYDASDSMIAALGWMHLDHNGPLDQNTFKVTNVVEGDGKIDYDVSYWGKTEHRVIFSEKK